MLNNILNIEGVSSLSKNQQKSIKGGEVCNLECYCSSLTIVIQHAWNTGNAENGEIAIGAWEEHCESTYGQPSLQ
uniref:hypothetical protein n=1 Tax=Roseivirga sp. TaxID=1964215 RepID=UPI0040476A9F